MKPVGRWKQAVWTIVTMDIWWEAIQRKHRIGGNAVRKMRGHDWDRKQSGVKTKSPRESGKKIIDIEDGPRAQRHK